MAAMISPEWRATPNTDNRTIAGFEVAYSWTHFYIVSVFLGFLIICIICGNALVVLAVLTERHLRVVSNYLILSLAVADLLVAVIVMPLSVVHEVSKVWWLGLPLCDLWICADVLLCTASTLHLCAIAIERALAVSNLAYLRHRPASFILIMIGICWILAAMVSLPARFHPRRNLVIPEVIYNGVCEVNMEKGFTIYSNLLAFDIPMIFTVLMYVRIYFAARKHIRKKHFSKYHTNSNNAANETSKKNNFVYQPPITPEGKEGHQYCCHCCGYVMETKFHKGGTMFKLGLTRRSEFQCSSSSEKPTITTTAEPPETVVAAAVSAMKIAATMIRTTKEPEWGNCDYESSGSDETFQLNTLSAVKNSTFEEVSSDEDEKAIKIRALTYEIIRNYHKKKEINANALNPDTTVSQDASIYTNHSSILFADENSKPNSLSSSVYSTLMHNSDSRELESVSRNDDPQKPMKNFLPLSMYYKRKRQQRWLEQSVVLNKKATEVMKHLSVNEPDLEIRQEEERYMRERIEQKRERKTVRTLAIITGCFVLCWLPFNLNALLSPFIGRIHPVGVSFLLWLGYTNSLLNPIIYTIFSKEFRCAFRRIICQGPRLNCFR
ncbi:unnamed protein product [Rodentolepis nana]|uniref:G_PROTEIN_RECEP_F1_2 domain-containing protein n=1 Tax=Rodentolepis nana TaxID=102285 RepID=A0A0R3TJH4_RODNA|nr:unnamed protein product [Rodentolepis nana]